jgi:predicted PurR-regulated permease PerM
LPGGIRRLRGLLAHLANVDPVLKEVLGASEMTRLEVHGTEGELAKLREPLSSLRPTYFTLRYGFQCQPSPKSGIARAKAEPITTGRSLGNPGNPNSQKVPNAVSFFGRTQTVTFERSAENTYIARAVEASINIGLVALLVAVCLLILAPFVPVIAWGIIISVASYPAVQRLQRALQRRGAWAAVIWTVLLLAVLIVPVILLATSMVDGVHNLTERMNAETFTVPPPPPGIESWPLIGAPLNRIWSIASNSLTEALTMLAPQLKIILPALLSASAGIGLTVLQFFFSILIAGALLAKAQSATAVARAFANRLFGDRGAEFHNLVSSTIRSVTSGILGVALIQAVLAAVGFLVVGLPGAGLWAVIFLVAAVLQVGILVLIPAVVLVFAAATTTTAVIFLIWCMFVGLLDNVLKPLLLGRGASVPTAVVFLGAIGGFVAMGIIGLFVGAIILSVGYELFLAWLEPKNAGSANTAGA